MNLQQEVPQSKIRSLAKSDQNKLLNDDSGIFLFYFVKSIIILKFCDWLDYFVNVLAYFVVVLAYFVIEWVFGLAYFSE